MSKCENCQRVGGNITRKNEMPQQPLIFCEMFDVWGIDFTSSLPNSARFSYVLLVVDYCEHPILSGRKNKFSSILENMKFHLNFARFIFLKRNEKNYIFSLNFNSFSKDNIYS